MKLAKLPVWCLIVVAIILVAMGIFIWQIWINHEQVDVLPSAEQKKTVFPIPLAASLIQVGGLIITVLLAFMPIQSMAFHQAKKCLLEEILSLLKEYEKSVDTTYAMFFDHQLGKWCEDDTGTTSRIKITFEQKKLHALLSRVLLHLPNAESTQLSDAAKVWWADLLGDQGFISTKNARWRSDDPRCGTLLEKHYAFLQIISVLRQRCLFDDVKYWEVPPAKKN